MAKELLARAEYNGYKREAHREEDGTRYNEKYNDKAKMNQNAVLDPLCFIGNQCLPSGTNFDAESLHTR
jgi:hypothetical protein